MEELRTVGIEPGLVVANQVLPDEVCTTAYAKSRQQMQRKYLSEMRRRFRVPILAVPLLPKEISGRDMLASLGNKLFGGKS
jgi:anion-transporting  ArsA/GET3 family ATPase